MNTRSRLPTRLSPQSDFTLSLLVALPTIIEETGPPGTCLGDGFERYGRTLNSLSVLWVAAGSRYMRESHCGEKVNGRRDSEGSG